MTLQVYSSDNMAERVDQHFFLKGIFPNAGPALCRLLQGAADNSNLLRTDYYSIRDWLEIAHCASCDEAYALLLLMLTALEEGSVCIETTEDCLIRRLGDLVSGEEAIEWVRRVRAVLASDTLRALIGDDALDHKPLIQRTAHGRSFVYFQKLLRAELEFEQELANRLAAKPPTDVSRWREILCEVLASQPLRLDRDQQMALASALINQFAIISGGPGTGKTSIVLSLLRCLIRGKTEAGRIALAAPTGRAAQRLSESIRAGAEGLTDAGPLRDVQATTLHRLLGYVPSRHLFTRHRENPVDADVIIIDEVSMVGIAVISQLMQALAPTTKLVLLGDKDQLPSVDAGAVLASLVPGNFQNGFHGDAAAQLATLLPDLPLEPTSSTAVLQNHVVLLRTNHRSQEHIRVTAAAINHQDSSVVDRLPHLDLTETFESHQGCLLLEQTSATGVEMRGFVKRWIEESFFQSRHEGKTLAEWLEEEKLDDAERARRLFPLIGRFRLLTLVREGTWGCNEINRFADTLLRPRLDGDTHSPLFAGALVLITRNDADRGLFNGDVGIAVRGAGSFLRVLFERPGGGESFPAEALPAHELGFALTVHKSQGSEYQNVMVVLPPSGGRRLLTKELLYTAVTRAKNLAVICSTREALDFAIRRKIVRETAFVSP